MSPTQVEDGPGRRGRVAVGTATAGTVLIAGLAPVRVEGQVLS